MQTDQITESPTSAQGIKLIVRMMPRLEWKRGPSARKALRAYLRALSETTRPKE